jgi:hypothetical protein
MLHLNFRVESCQIGPLPLAQDPSCARLTKVLLNNGHGYLMGLVTAGYARLLN